MDELKKIAPELSKLKKENPFRVPDTYFDDFSARLRMKIDAEKEVRPEPKNRIIQFLKPALSLAASFALIFMLVYWPLKTYVPNQVADNNVQTESYDDDYYALFDNIDEYALYAWMNEPAPTETEEISEEELETYLSTNFSEYDIYNMENDF